MQLVLEVVDAKGVEPVPPVRKTFAGAGGVIGRGAGCDWVIPDSSRLLSSHHGLISYREGRYFLTDISSNGIGVDGSDERLLKGQARLISDVEVFQLGTLTIRARLSEPPRQYSELREATAGVIPDDAFLGLDPVQVLDREHLARTSSDELEALKGPPDAPGECVYQNVADRDYMTLPRWAEPAEDALPPPPAITRLPANEDFWGPFAAALGIPLDNLDTPGREALAIKVAGLLRQGIEGLQQTLRTCDELKSELNLAPAEPLRASPNPLRHGTATDATLAALLGITGEGAAPAGPAITQAFRDVQTHQVALLTACRAVVRGARAAFAPGHLLLCFERQGKPPRFKTDGAYWRAYQRHYQRLIDDEPVSERLLGNDFANAYGEQVRLISTLHAVYPG